jgi:hypothetical protein
MAALLKRAAAKRVSGEPFSVAPALLAAAVAGAAAAVITYKLLATERCPWMITDCFHQNQTGRRELC